MWSPFGPIASLVAGLFGNIQQPLNILGGHGNLTELTPSQFAGFIPYIEFARAAYCDSKKIAGWNWGDACISAADFQLTLTGGDGDSIQFFYVGYWPAQSSVVVAHQGTDPHEILAIRTDADLRLVDPDPTLFPRIPPAAKIHDGFAIEHEKTASQILAEVRKLMAKYSSTNVILVGHSLGGALAELDSIFMKLHLPVGTTIRGVTFGVPRVGNKHWATFFDSHISDFTRINNKRDPVPTIPGIGLGYSHPSGEIHIEEDGSVVVCPGPDDGVDPQCSGKMVPEVFYGVVDHHTGPYNGVFIGTQHCTP